MLEAVKLNKVYPNKTRGLIDLNLEVNRGEIFCLLGANGAGKTTTLNLFLDFIEPTSGHCSINGCLVKSDPVAAKRHVGYLAESVMLYGTLTAYQNLDFFARVAGFPLTRGEQKDAFARVGLPPTACDRRVKTFSKGMRQKVGIAIALVKNPPALILDEPLSGLDPIAAAELVETLRHLRDQGEGKAILMTTHDIFRAKDLANRVAIMWRGEKVEEYTSDDLRAGNLEELYRECVKSQESTSPPMPRPFEKQAERFRAAQA